MLTYYLTLIIVIAFATLAQLSCVERSFDGSYVKPEIYTYKNGGYYFFTFAVALVLICVAGLRYRVGTDYGNYMALYENRKTDWISDLISFNEPGFAIMSKLSSLIYDDYATVFFFASALTIGLYVWTIGEYSRTFLFSILLFVFVGTWAGTFGAIRQYIGAAVVFAGHRYIYERKFGKYLLVVFGAAFFHRTVLVMLPLYFIATKKISWKTIAVLVVATIMLMRSYDLVFDIMSRLKGSDQSRFEYMKTELNVFRVAVAFAPLALFAISSKRVQQDPETQFYMMLMMVNAVFMLAMSNSAYLARVGIFTESYAVFAYPRILKGFSMKMRSLLGFFILILYLLYFSYQVYTSSSLNHFQWIFSR